MRVIVTGGTGLIGKALVNDLVGAGHEVVVLTRNTNKSSGLPRSTQLVRWDGVSAEGWGHLADGAGAIVNLAGSSISGEGFLPDRWTDARKKQIMESRENAGRAVVEAVRAANVKPGVVIQSSAVGYYGTHGDEPITEASPAGDDFLADVCKRWEASTQAIEAAGVRRAIARTGIVLSMQGGAFPRLVLPFRLFAGGPLGSGKQQLPWIHIADEVGALRFLIENQSATGPYNLSAPNPINNGQFARILGKVMSRPSFIPVPGFAFKLGFGEVATVVLDGQRALPERLLAAGYTFRFPEPEGAIRNILQTNV